MNISFIIPAYNEAGNIEDLIASIKRYVPDGLQYEIIVVDHGSTDDTVILANACGADVMVCAEGTIAGLRNLGVKKSSGEILIFLDADIRLTHDWAANIGKVLKTLIDGDRILTGSWYSIPESPSWIEKFWFKPLERGDNTHINSGHLIISRHLFEEIGGFNETLETGEDYDISMRAKAANIRLLDDVKLKVVHEGYPGSLAEFVKREFWHGKGDAASITSLFQSKVAIVSLIFLLLHFTLILSSIMLNKTWIYISVASIAVIVVGVAAQKYRSEPVRTILVNSFIYYMYFWARAISILSLPGIRKIKKRVR